MSDALRFRVRRVCRQLEDAIIRLSHTGEGTAELFLGQAEGLLSSVEAALRAAEAGKPVKEGK